jgi:mono/diheme cytochrome c family protein
MTSRALALLPLLLPAVALAEAPRMGDLENGALLIQVHCAVCHGSDARGGGELAAQLPKRVFDLRDPAYLSSRSNADLLASIAKGGGQTKAGVQVMPAFPMLTNFDLWDIVAYLRNGQIGVAQFFPDAKYFTAKKYAFDKNAQARLEKEFGHPLSAQDKEMTLVAVFGQSPDGAPPEALTPTPLNLDRLLPKEKDGYMVFVDLPVGPAGPTQKRATTGIAIAKDGKILKVGSAGSGTGLTDQYPQFIGLGAKGQTELLTPVAPKAKGKAKPVASSAADRPFAEAYARALEAIGMWDHEERERHWADPR